MSELCDPLRPSESFAVEDSIDILQDIDDNTHLLDKKINPSIQDMEILTASVICKLQAHVIKTSSLSTMALLLKDNILNYRQYLFQKFSIIQLVLQVSCFLTPKCKTDAHKKFLGRATEYTMPVESSTKILHNKITSFFI